MKPGEIDMTSTHETSAPFMDRVATLPGLARELMELHRLIVEQGLLPAGSHIADRFSILTGFAAGTLWRLDSEDPLADGLASRRRTP